jgi:hypothetical protein
VRECGLLPGIDRQQDGQGTLSEGAHPVMVRGRDRAIAVHPRTKSGKPNEKGAPASLPSRLSAHERKAQNS